MLHLQKLIVLGCCLTCLAFGAQQWGSAEEFAGMVEGDSLVLDQTPDSSKLIILSNTLVPEQRFGLWVTVNRKDTVWESRLGFGTGTGTTIDLSQELGKSKGSIWGGVKFDGLQAGDELSFKLRNSGFGGTQATFDIDPMTDGVSGFNSDYEVDGYFSSKGRKNGVFEWTFADPFSIGGGTPVNPGPGPGPGPGVSGQPLPGTLTVMALGAVMYGLMKKKKKE